LLDAADDVPDGIQEVVSAKLFIWAWLGVDEPVEVL